MMHAKKIIAGLWMITVASYAVMSPLTGQDQQEHYVATPTGFAVGLEAYHHLYKETVLDKFFMSNEGNFAGLLLSYTHPTFLDHVAWQLRWTFAKGEIDYDSDGSGKMSEVDNVTDDIALHIIHDIRVAPTVTYSPYYGIGFRIHEDKKQNKLTDSGYSGYYRLSEYTYFPIGLRAHIEVANNWHLSPYAQWNAYYQGRQLSDLSDDIINNQYKGNGYELGGSARILSTIGSFEIGGFYRHWSIEDSSIVKYRIGLFVMHITEPENTTDESGFMLIYRPS